MKPGDRVIWRATISNYGHTREYAATVVRVGPKRVTIRTAFPYLRDRVQTSVKPESLRPASTPATPTGEEQ